MNNQGVVKLGITAALGAADRGFKSHLPDQIKKLVKDGCSIREIEHETGIKYSSIRYWLKKLKIKTCHNKNGINKNKLFKKRKIDSIKWDVIQKAYDDGDSFRVLIQKFKLNYTLLDQACKNRLLVIRNHSNAIKNAFLNGRYGKMSEETKNKIRNSIIKLFERQPELHPNRKVANNRKVMTFPERIVYDLLTILGVKFEHNKKIGKYYIDFYITDLNIGLEVDGERWHDPIYDNKRDIEILDMSNIRIIRFKAKDIIKDVNIIKTVMDKRDSQC